MTFDLEISDILNRAKDDLGKRILVSTNPEEKVALIEERALYQEFLDRIESFKLIEKTLRGQINGN